MLQYIDNLGYRYVKTYILVLVMQKRLKTLEIEEREFETAINKILMCCK